MGADEAFAGPDRDARARGLTIRVGVTLGEHALDLQSLWTAVQEAERLGYDSIWLSDTATQDGFAPLLALAAIAARTQRIKLGTSVLVLPPRNPVLLARELAAVDVLSGGRLLPAGGLGLSTPDELAALGVVKGERVARLEEAIAVLRLLWTGEAVDFAGRFTAFSGLRLAPSPTRRRLEFWLGGRARPALERVGRIADGWLGAFVSVSEFAAATDVIRASATAAGRTIDEDHYGTTLFASEDGDADPQDVAALRMRRDLSSAEHFAAGPAAARELLARFVAAGASKFVLVPVTHDLPGWLETMRPAIAEVEGVAA
jgi:probable F420-dependent oxidoreductase